MLFKQKGTTFQLLELLDEVQISLETPHCRSLSVIFHTFFITAQCSVFQSSNSMLHESRRLIEALICSPRSTLYYVGQS